MIGTKLAHYEITSHLGTGGMGEVYQATDAKLGRSVAIKLLPAAFTNDHDRAARFEREARVLASLNHPNIAAIYGIEESGGRKFLVMELAGGETLEQRIKRGAIPIDDAIGIAKAIAEGLEAAHEQGIIHRDLKPANIKVTPNGKVKVLDFGLAKAFAGETVNTNLSNSPTLSPAATQHGMILGTAAYMSPEQARGLEVDARTDIFAFGAVLYEMLTGRQSFGGEDLPDILSKVLRSNPDQTLLPADLPANVRRVLTRCLQKNPDRRTRDIADARLELEEAEAVASAVHADTRAQRLSGRNWIVVLGIFAAFVAGLALWMGRLWERRNPPAAIEWQGDLLGGSTVAMQPRISPDGQMLAFAAMVDGQTQVAVMRPQSGNWTVLSHEKTRGQVEEMSWSHDGTRIFFSRQAEVPRGVFSIPSLGGEERLVLENAQTPEALSDGSLLVVRFNAQRVPQLFHFWPENGRLDALDALLGDRASAPPVRVFADGREAVFLGRTSAAPGQQALYAIDLKSGRTRQLASGLPFYRDTAIATTPDGQSVLLNILSGSRTQIVEVPRDGSQVVRPLFTVTNLYAMDVGPDGSIYMDQYERLREVYSYSPANGRVDRLTLPDFSASGRMILPLNDGRLLFGTLASGRQQLAVLAPGKDAVAFLETDEESSPPFTLVGKDRFAFMLGSVPNQRIAIASLSDHRIVGRLQKPNTGNIKALAGLPDRDAIYYVESGFVWATTIDGSEPRKVHEGDFVAVDPTDQTLIIEVTTKEGVRLARVPSSGAAEQPIPMPSGLRLIADLSSGAVGPDGRIVVRFAPKDNWFWPAAILEPRSGKLAELPGVRDLDMISASWAPEGRLVSAALSERSALWRFRPVRRGE